MFPTEIFYPLCITTIDHWMRRENERRPVVQRRLDGIDTDTKRFRVDVAKVRNVTGPRDHIVGPAVTKRRSDDFASTRQRQGGHRQHMSPETADHGNGALDDMKFRKAQFQHVAQITVVGVALVSVEHARIIEKLFDVRAIKIAGGLRFLE